MSSLILLAKFPNTQSRLICPSNNLIINISYIGNKLNIKSGKNQISSNQIKRNLTHRMPKMRNPVHRRPTNIHANLAFIQRNKLFLLPRQSIIQSQHKKQNSQSFLILPIKSQSNLFFIRGSKPRDLAQSSTSADITLLSVGFQELLRK